MSLCVNLAHTRDGTLQVAALESLFEAHLAALRATLRLPPPIAANEKEPTLEPPCTIVYVAATSPPRPAHC